MCVAFRRAEIGREAKKSARHFSAAHPPVNSVVNRLHRSLLEKQAGNSSVRSGYLHVFAVCRSPPSSAIRTYVRGGGFFSPLCRNFHRPLFRRVFFVFIYGQTDRRTDRLNSVFRNSYISVSYPCFFSQKDVIRTMGILESVYQAISILMNSFCSSSCLSGVLDIFELLGKVTITTSSSRSKYEYARTYGSWLGLQWENIRELASNEAMPRLLY